MILRICISFVLLSLFTQCDSDSNKDSLLSDINKNEITKIVLFYPSPSNKRVAMRKIIEKPAQIRYFLEKLLGKGKKVTRTSESKYYGSITLHKDRGTKETLEVYDEGKLIKAPNTWFVSVEDMYKVLENLHSSASVSR